MYTKFTTIMPVSRATKLHLTGSRTNPGQWKGIEQAMEFPAILRLGNEACGTSPHAVLRIEVSCRSFMGLLRIEAEEASFLALRAEIEDFWEGMERIIVTILESQMVGRLWGNIWASSDS